MKDKTVLDVIRELSVGARQFTENLVITFGVAN